MILLMRAFSVSVVLPLALLSGMAGAQEIGITQDDLKTYEERLEQERQALAALNAAKDAARTDMNAVNRQLISAAQESLRREEQAAKIERRLVDLEIRERAARDQLMVDRAGLQQILTALISSSRKRPPALVTHPDKATDAIQAAIVMRDVADQLEDRSKELAEKVRTYADLSVEVQKEKDELGSAEARLAEKEQEIRKLAAIKRARFEDISGETEKLEMRIELLAEKAESIKTLLADLQANAPPAPSRKPSILTEPGVQGADSPIAVAVLKRLGLPAVGQIVSGFGDDLPSGQSAEGITVRTRAAAQVVAPADGEIVFSGPFRSYGQMLILRTGDGYHIVLSGLASIYGARGQSVLAGEPVGQMSDQEDVPVELYMELRKDGTPEDPAKWMSRSAG